MKTVSILFLVLLFFLASASPLQAAGLVPCGGDKEPPCDFNYLVGSDKNPGLIQNVLNFLITLSVSVAAIALMIGGWYMVTARGSESQLSQGKKIIGAAVVGLIIVLGAWLIVTAIIKFLGPDESVITLPKDPAP